MSRKRRRIVCPECTAIMVKPDYDVILFTPFWRPGLTDEEVRRLAVAVRAETTQRHAKEGHPA